MASPRARPTLSELATAIEFTEGGIEVNTPNFIDARLSHLIDRKTTRRDLNLQSPEIGGYTSELSVAKKERAAFMQEAAFIRC